jgi:hypothetical protein
LKKGYNLAREHIVYLFPGWEIKEKEKENTSKPLTNETRPAPQNLLNMHRKTKETKMYNDTKPGTLPPP